MGTSKAHATTTKKEEARRRGGKSNEKIVMNSLDTTIHRQGDYSLELEAQKSALYIQLERPPFDPSDPLPALRRRRDEWLGF